LFGAAYTVLATRVHRSLGTPRGSRRLSWAQRFNGLLPVVLLVLYGVDLWAGWLGAVRSVTGDLVLIDDLIALAPTFALLLWTWWCWYPVDRRLRDAMIFRRADAGLPVHPVWTRGEYLAHQWRHQVLVLLVPVLLIIGWSESLLWAAGRGMVGGTALAVLSPLGGLAVFFAAPLGMRYLFDTVSLPAGGIRDRVLEVCRETGVRIRDVLLWRTHGGMANAAVMGVAAPVRYLMFTDALLEEMPRQQVEAVLAHELGHVRHRHIPALVLNAIGWLSGLMAAAGLLAATVPAPGWAEPTLMIAAVAAWLLVFGWASRRVERQADVFAARYIQRSLAAEPDHEASSEPQRFSPAAVSVVANALLHVSALNHMDPRRFNWRHGSIASRVSYLRSLAGRPVDRLPVDRTVRRMNLIAAGLLVLVVAGTWAGWV
jgi:STE24 endopeptidase